MLFLNMHLILIYDMQFIGELNMMNILIYDMQFIGELSMMNILLTQDLRVFICSLF
jgi:hypothetical protein